MKEIWERQKQKEVIQISITEQPNPQEQKVHSLLLLFTGPKGTTIVKNLNKAVKNVLPSNVKTHITHTGQKANIRFQIKDKINQKHKHDLVQYTKFSETSCTEEYLGESGCRITERVADHSGKNKQSYLLKHALLQNHRLIDLTSMKITDSRFHGNKLKWEISEVLHIKENRPSLSSQEQLVELKLFN